MRLFRKKSELQRFIDSVRDSLEVPSGKAAKAALIAVGGLAGLTAGSAGISSLRRQREASDS